MTNQRRIRKERIQAATTPNATIGDIITDYSVLLGRVTGGRKALEAAQDNDTREFIQEGLTRATEALEEFLRRPVRRLDI